MTWKFDKSFLKAPDTKYLIALLPRLQEKRVQNFTTLALTLITFSVFAIFAISPTLGTITDLQKQISDNQFVNDQLQKKISALAVLQDNYTKLKPQLPAVFAGIPTTPEIAIFLGQLQTVAEISNVTVERVQTLPVDLATSTPQTKYSAYAFNIDVAGSHDSTITFLKNLTSLNRLISIEALSFGRTSRLAQLYDLNIRGDVYFSALDTKQ